MELWKVTKEFDEVVRNDVPWFMLMQQVCDNYVDSFGWWHCVKVIVAILVSALG